MNRDNSIVTRHLYCHECKGLVGTGQKPSEECPCKACRPNEKSAALKYFLQIDLSSQIAELLDIPHIIESLNYRFTRKKKNLDAFEDIYDGEEYRKLCSPRNFLDNPYNYSLTMNTDGCQVANSSNASAWPVYFQINELPPHMRKKYMLLAGIFVDDKHPLMNNLLRPVIDELKNLYETGIVWEPSRATEVTSRFVVTVCSVDSPARSLITRTKQFNGYYGCLFCYAKGERNSQKHVYSMRHNFGRLRSHKEIKADMLKAYETKNIVNGVKGISSLIALPLFDVINGTVAKAMHAVFLGAIKQHTILLLTVTDSDFYIGSPNNQNEIDNHLLTIRPPSRRSRLPRSIKIHKQWKASEWRNWLDYAPSCLERIIDVKYVEHVALLSQAIHYLNNDSVTVRQLHFAGSLLKTYVTLFEEYFGVQNMSFNIHLLTHLTHTVRNSGPIWAHSAFTFESWNKKIIDKVTSPHARADQIATRFLMSKFVESVAYDDNTAIETKNFVRKILKTPDVHREVKIDDNVINLGSTETRMLIDIEKRDLLRFEYDLPETITTFVKVKINGIEYRCSNDATKYCNSIVFCSRYGFGQIVAMIRFEQRDSPVYGFYMKCFQVEESSFHTHYMKRVKITNQVIFCNTLQTIRPAVKISTSEGTYVFKLTNCWETD